MLKLAPLEANTFYNIKCGEIFCLTSVLYNVTCICGQKVHLDQFITHFQQHHLPKDDSESTDDISPPTREEDPIETNADGFETDISLSELDAEEDEQTDGEQINDDTKDENQVDLTRFPGKLANNDEEKPEQITEIPENGDNEWQIDDFSDQSEEKEDEKPNVDVSPHPCKQCIRTYKSRHSLLKHIRKNHKNKPVADEKEDQKSNMDFPSFPCTQCARTYKNRSCLRAHIRKKHENKPKREGPKLEYKCEDCGAVFRSEQTLRGHRWKHTGIFCDICGKTFTQPGNMIRHKIRHTGIRAHKCKECDYSFFTVEALRAHSLRHTELLIHICEVCGRKCRDRGVLKLHMRRHTGERPAKCPECGKCFYTFHDLKLHSVVHTTERPYQCDICKATFQLTKSLRVHKRLHSKDGKKHECKVCGQKFFQSSGLRSHMRTHDAALGTSSIISASVATSTFSNSAGKFMFK